MEFFTSRGIPLKTERGRRVFPESDSAQDIRHCLRRETEKKCTCVRDSVKELLVNDGSIAGVKTASKTYCANNVIIATGGKSYPRTGSTGDGYRLASEVGHSVVTPRGSLVPLVCSGNICPRLMGLSLRNIGVRFIKDQKVLYSDEGELLFTHFGVSGPTVLSASAVIGNKFPFELSIDLKPALDHETLDKRLLKDFAENKNKIYSNSLGALLPAKLIPVFVSVSGIDPNKKVNEITKEERKNICSLLKSFTVNVIGTRSVEEAIVTSGGISVKEINPSTMESKIIKGLYFAGEVIDVDAYTGGYNLQIAFSTGHLAGNSI
jgi:predicted Rossmann fold flavoprotein